MHRLHGAATALLLTFLVGGQAFGQIHIDWPTYGFDSHRGGFNNQEHILGQASVGKLTLAWSFNPGTYELAIDPSISTTNAKLLGQPIVASGVPIKGTPADLVLVADRNGYIFALDAYSASPTGTVVWHRNLGARTIDCDGTTLTIGARAAVAVDRAANGSKGAVYLSMNGRAHGLDLASGAELPGWPVIVPTPVQSGLNQQGLAEHVVSLSRDLTQTLGFAGPALADGDYYYGSTPVVFEPTACAVANVTLNAFAIPGF
jgi:hypothetical protein